MANINYLRSGDYFVPDIQLSVVGDTPLGKYARMRREFLEVNNPLLLSDPDRESVPSFVGGSADL